MLFRSTGGSLTYLGALFLVLLAPVFTGLWGWLDRFGAIQLNHMFVVNTELSSQRPDVVRAIYGMLKQAAAAAPKQELGVNALPFGVEANRRNLEVALDNAHRQRLIDSPMRVDDLFDATTIDLN